ncbi:MAG: SpoIIE family protein phosphatase [Paludibacteraceae bacterium]|nr:SpoIIE family protein phosphatase [Paludibacteraceae bacterium]
MKIKYLPIVGAVFLVIAMTIQFVLSYRRNKEDIMERIDHKMEMAQKDVTSELYDMSDAVSEIASYLPQHAKDTTTQYELFSTVLWRFPDLYSCYFFYKPNHFPNQTRHVGIGLRRAGKDSIIHYRYENMSDYFEREWFKGAMLSDNNGYWSRTYRDVDSDTLIFSYALKVYDEHDNNIIGVAGADYTLEWAQQLLLLTRPYEDAVCQLYNPDGTLIVQTGEIDRHNMIVSEKTMSPANMKLVIGVPDYHLWDGMMRLSLITFIVLVIGILVAGLLIRRLWRDQAKYVRSETENRVMEKELRIASNIQKSILRIGERDKVKAADKWSDIELQAALEPMREVGGDLYDFYRKDDDLYFIIGDVSGKSVTAAMFMAATVNLFRSAVRRLQSPKAIMEDINAVLSDNNPKMMFVTAFVGRLHIPTGEVLYCNAGHLPPIKVQSDDVQCTKHGARSAKEIALIPNIPLGYDGTFRFEEQGTMLYHNDTLVLYTDGITEARNEKREMLGMKRWKQIVEENISPLNKVDMYAIAEAGLKFIGKAEQTDDMTLMTIRLTQEVQPLTVRVENRLDQWPILKNALHNYGLCAGLNKPTLKRLQLAVEEAVVNIVRYSQATEITLTARHSPLTITLTDNGTIFDPTAQKETDIVQNAEGRQIGGLGITLLRQIADELRYQRIEDKNELTIIKNL